MLITPADGESVARGSDQSRCRFGAVAMLETGAWCFLALRLDTKFNLSIYICKIRWYKLDSNRFAIWLTILSHRSSLTLSSRYWLMQVSSSQSKDHPLIFWARNPFKRQAHYFLCAWLYERKGYQRTSAMAECIALLQRPGYDKEHGLN